MDSNNNYCVYCHTNLINGKKYIGKTKDVNMRWAGDGRGYLYNNRGNNSYTVFANAIRKYGWDNFSHEILMDNLTNEEACKWETYYIDYYKTQIGIHDVDYGYNMTSGGEGSPGRIISEETREKLVKSHLGKKQSEETKRKLSLAFTGRKMSKESIQKALRNRPSQKGIPISEEHKRHISEAQKGRKPSDYTIQRSIENSSIPVICEETGEAFRSITDAATAYSVCVSAIASHCKGRKETVRGLHFHYLQKDDTDIDYSFRLPKLSRENIIAHSINKRSQEIDQEKRKRCIKPVLCMDNNTIYESGVLAAKELGISNKSISECCIGKTKTTKGYKFRFATNEDFLSNNYTYIAS